MSTHHRVFLRDGLHFQAYAHAACAMYLLAAFSGPVPATLGKLGSKGNGIVEIYLQNNKLTGTLPSNIEQLTSLQKFDVSNNTLEGELPRLHLLPKLEVDSVKLAGNDFACPMPSEDLVYDTATCTCKAGYKGAKGDTDGESWDTQTCRNEESQLLTPVGVNVALLSVLGVDVHTFTCICAHLTVHRPAPGRAASRVRDVGRENSPTRLGQQHATTALRVNLLDSPE